jgi:YVTN family beta-propeller protein
MTLLWAGPAQAGTGFGVLTAIGVGVGPNAVAVAPGGSVYVANSGDDSVSFISSYLGVPTAVSKTIFVGADPVAVAVGQSGNPVYVANAGDDTVSVIDMSGYEPNTDTVVDTISLPAGDVPVALAVDSSTGNVYVAGNGPAGTGMLSAIKVSGYTGTVTGSISLPAGDDPVGLAINSFNGNVYVGTNADAVWLFNDRTGFRATIPVPNPIAALAVDPSTDSAYVANGDELSVINALTLEAPIYTDPEGVHLYRVAVDSTAHSVYLMFPPNPNGDSYVEQIDESTGVATNVTFLGSYNFPGAIAVDPSTGFVYVTTFPSMDDDDNGTMWMLGPWVSPAITESPAAATVGTAYSFPFYPTGFPTPTVTWAAPQAGEELPPGMNMTSSGTLYGTPTTPGTFTFEVTASNGFAPADSETVTLIISPAPAPPPRCHVHCGQPKPICHHLCV